MEEDIKEPEFWPILQKIWKRGKAFLSTCSENQKLQMLVYFRQYRDEYIYETFEYFPDNPESVLEGSQTYRMLCFAVELLEPEAPEEKPRTPKWQLHHIALYYVLSGQEMNQNKAGEIAAEYGFKGKNSGRDLFDFFEEFKDESKRKGSKVDNLRSLTNNRKRYETIIPKLEGKHREKAEAELEEVKNRRDEIK